MCDQCRAARGVVECIHLGYNTKCARCTKLGKRYSFQGGSVTGTDTEDSEDPPTPPRKRTKVVSGVVVVYYCADHVLYLDWWVGTFSSGRHRPLSIHPTSVG